MGNSMPLLLIFAWALFFAFLNCHWRYARYFRGSSQVFYFILHISVILGSLVGLGLMGYYFVHVEWYWPFALFILGSFLSGIVLATIEMLIGQLFMSIISFVGWPISAIWLFIIISDI
ncbi:MAG: hypothetical protein RLZZ384_507 [Pseudomonadota bacterium]